MGGITRSYDSLGRGYRPVLRWAIGHRKTVLAITLAIFALSGWLFTLVGIGGTPHGNRPEFNIKVQVASGSSLESTERTVRRIEDILRREPEIKDVFSVIGTTDGSSDEATVNVKLKGRSGADVYQDQLRPKLARIAGARLTFQESMSISGNAAQSFQQLPIQINIKSPNLDSLTMAADEIRRSLAGIPQLVDLNSDYRAPKPEIQIQIDRERASQLGANTLQIASAMRSFVDGDIASRFRQGEKLYDIRVLASDDTREDLDRLSKVYIPTMRGGLITLDQVAQFKVVNGPTQIKRKDRVRQVTVVSNILQGAALNEVTRKVQDRLDAIALPKDVTYDFGGQVETNAEMFQTLTISLGLAIVFVYMILASQFGSFLQPFALMLALPLSIVGAILGLLAANKLFDMVAFIGLIMLMGLVTKNSILLIDYTNVLRRRGLDRTDGHPRSRSDPAPAHPDDLAGHDPGHDPGRLRPRRQLELPGRHRLHHHRRHHLVDGPDAGHRARVLRHHRQLREPVQKKETAAGDDGRRQRTRVVSGSPALSGRRAGRARRRRWRWCCTSCGRT